MLLCPGYFEDLAEWKGVPVSILLGKTVLKPGAAGVTVRSVDSYETTFYLERPGP
jgi:DMSO/TMAO reductase YedYZ molybdopterin-dependent catalytic subunit